MLKTFLIGLQFITFSIFGMSFNANADDEKLQPLRVSVTYFTPPFVMSNGYSNFIGFDINMMAYICSYLKRDCQYKAMEFADLIPSITNKQADLAVSGIIITPNRLLQVAMSNPYLVSASRFVTNSKNNVNELKDDILLNSKIGVEKGSVFGEQLNTWKINGIEIVEFSQEAEEIQALVQRNIDYALMDNYTSIYWVKHSENKLKLLGKSIKYGYGYGIAIDPQNADLIKAVNEAINSYINANQYKEDYNLYFLDF